MKLRGALKEVLEHRMPNLPDEEISLYNTHNELNPEQCFVATLAFEYVLGIFHEDRLSGRDLYVLLSAYLQNPDVTKEINAVLGNYGMPVLGDVEDSDC